MTNARITRPELYMAAAHLFAQRSTCLRAQVGAVIVHENHIISHGYVGSPSKQPQCIDEGVGCLVPPCRCGEAEAPPPHHHAIWCPSTLGCQRTIHAEANAIAWAAHWGVSCAGATMYSTHEPCVKCAHLIIAAGIPAVFYSQPYRLGATPLLAQSRVTVRQL